MADYTVSLPAKRMAACALLFNQQQEWLIVKPTYRPEWLVPGGTVDADESPLTACKREIKEEIGLDLPVSQLLCVDYQSAHGSKTECMQFVFWGGVLTDAQIDSIQLPPDELSESRFVSPEVASQLLVPQLSQRLQFAAQARRENRIIYLEDKQEPPILTEPWA
jgi:8-oxo-dGTP pyrophosphatase MutT (NUDIX family)